MALVNISIRFARYPPYEVDHFLRSRAKGWHYNHMQVQELYSTTCGQFVVFYIYQKSRGLMLEVILRKCFISHNKLKNESEILSNCITT